MVSVRGGTFQMGDEHGDLWSGCRPVLAGILSDYQIGKYPVTQKQWMAVMGYNPSHFKGNDLPVEQVSWDDCQIFIKKLNISSGKKYRLPTEAEWEFAARGGTASQNFKYAGSNELNEVAWFSENAGSKMHPVGQKKANELGLYDMSGNVWEWCNDWYDPYPSQAQHNPAGTKTGALRVDRGGSWGGGAQDCRVAYRNYNSPGNRFNDLGFRLASSSR